jgi:hypothetical protein
MDTSVVEIRYSGVLHVRPYRRGTEPDTTGKQRTADAAPPTMLTRLPPRCFKGVPTHSGSNS